MWRPCACVRVHVRGERCATVPGALGPLTPRVSSRNRCHNGVTFGKNLKLVGALRWGRGFPRAAHLPPSPGASHARTGPFFSGICRLAGSFGVVWSLGLTISPPRQLGITASSACTTDERDPPPARVSPFPPVQEAVSQLIEALSCSAGGLFIPPLLSWSPTIARVDHQVHTVE